MLVTRISLAALALASTSLFALSSLLATAADGPEVSVRRVASARDASGSRQCVDRLAINPVATMTCSGTTLLGGWQLSTIAIYSNGLVTVSQASGAGGASSAGHALIDPQYVDNLQRELRRLGAHTLCDERFDVSDSLLTTVTVFSRGQDARAHTFSYWIPTGEYQDVDDAITNFMTERVVPQMSQ